MRGMRALRNFKPDRCYHLISRIANRAFYLTDEERTRFVERLWRVATFSGIRAGFTSTSITSRRCWRRGLVVRTALEHPNSPHQEYERI